VHSPTPTGPSPGRFYLCFFALHVKKRKRNKKSRHRLYWRLPFVGPASSFSSRTMELHVSSSAYEPHADQHFVFTLAAQLFPFL